MHLVFKKITGPRKLWLILDSAYRAEEPDGLAIRGAIYALGAAGSSPGGTLQVLDFQSKKLKTVARSTFAAELQSLHHGVSHGGLLLSFISECEFGPRAAEELSSQLANGTLKIDMEACIDAKSVYDAIIAADGPKQCAEPHLQLHVLSSREQLEAGMLRALWWLDTRGMLSDGLTKGGLDRNPILRLWTTGTWSLRGDRPTKWTAQPHPHTGASTSSDASRLGKPDGR